MSSVPIRTCELKNGISPRHIVYISLLYWLTAYVYMYAPVNILIIPQPLLKALPILILSLVSYRYLQGKDAWLSIGLLLSACGDIVADIPIGGFIPQVGCFMAAQLVYLMVFRREVYRSPLRTAVCCALMMYVGFVGANIFSSHQITGAILLAIGIYLVVISGMAMAAILRPKYYLAMLPIGAIMFVFSDSVIAWDRFVCDVAQSSSLIMWSYYLAQFLITSGYIADRRYNINK